MTPAELAHAAGFMNRLPFVTWDRCAGDEADFVAYGWIPRDDARSDFVTLNFSPLEPGQYPAFTTSSKRYSAAIHAALYGELEGVDDDAHFPCKRVEDVFGEIVLRKVEL